MTIAHVLKKNNYICSRKHSNNNHKSHSKMKRILFAAVLLLGMSTTLLAQNEPLTRSTMGPGMYNDPFAAQAVRHARMDALVRGWRLSVDGGGQRTWGFDARSLNNSRFDAEIGYRFNRISYLGASLGFSAYRLGLPKEGLTDIANYEGSKVGMPLSLTYRGYLLMQRFASPYAWARGTYAVSKAETSNLAFGLGVDFLLMKGATLFVQAGIGGIGMVNGEGFLKSRLDAADGWQTYSAGPVGEFSIGFSIPLTHSVDPYQYK